MWLQNRTRPSLKYMPFLSFLTLVLSQQVEARSFCEINSLCSGRGACAKERDDADDHSDLPLKCYCIPGYYGRWCQFLEDENQKDNTAKTALSGSPIILATNSSTHYEKDVKIQWGKTSHEATTPILYYSVRYKKFGIIVSKDWVFMDELATKGRVEYTAVLRNLEWGENYLVEVYAGTRNGVGEPAVRMISRPQVSMPRIQEISKRTVGYNLVFLGRSFKLKCHAQGTPLPFYAWYLNGMKLLRKYDNRAKINTVTGDLMVVNSTKKDEGVYRCLATNILGTVRSLGIEVKLLVSGDYVDTRSSTRLQVVSLANQTVYEGSSIQWECRVSGTPTPAVKWYYNGKRMDNMNDFSNNVQIFGTTLKIDHTEVTSSGIYQCTSTNQDGESTAAAYLDVKGVPKADSFSKSEQTSTVKAPRGRHVTLVCQVLAGGSKTRQTSWFRRNSILVSNTHKYDLLSDGRLMIKTTSTQDCGQYKCETNDGSFLARRILVVKVVSDVSGDWSSWSAWSLCEKPASGCVKHPRSRARECNNPAPENDGKYCPGSDVDYERCPFPLCPSASAWGPWTAWSACVPACGHHSQRSRHRKCRVLYSVWNKCHGEKMEVVGCSRHECPGEQNNNTMNLSKHLVKEDKTAGNEIKKVQDKSLNVTTTKKNNKNPPLLVYVVCSTSVVVLMFLACILHQRIQRKRKSKRMMKELFQTEPRSSVFKVDNIIEASISPNIGQELHQGSSTSIELGKRKKMSYIPPLPMHSKGEVDKINQTKSFESNETSKLIPPLQPRIVASDSQNDRNKFSGMLNSLIDNWMGTSEDESEHIITQDNMTSSQQPTTANLEKGRQEMTSPQGYAQTDEENAKDSSTDFVYFVDAVLTAADHGRVKLANLLSNITKTQSN